MVGFTDAVEKVAFEVPTDVSKKAALPESPEMPTKNTFIHFDEAESDGERLPRKEATCPNLLQRRAFRTKTFQKRQAEQKALLHRNGECKPCAYHAYKPDGCRLGVDCEYCHLCTRTQIRRRKRLYAAGRGEKFSSVSSLSTTTSSQSTSDTPRE